MINENAKLTRRITELEKLEHNIIPVQEQLRIQQKEHQIIFDLAPACIWNLDHQGRILRVNKASAIDAGLPAEDMIGKFVVELLSPDKAQIIVADIQEIIDSGKPRKGVIKEYSFLSGERRWIRSDKIPYFGNQGEPNGIIVFLVDITEQKNMQYALLESEEIFNLFMEHNPIYVFFKDENIRLIRLSRNYEKMLNMPLNKILGKTMDEIFPSELAKSMIEDDRRILHERKFIEVEEELNGRYYTTIKFPILREGKPTYLAGFTVDITKQKENETALENNLARLRKLIGYIISVIGRTVELRDPYTGNHQKRVSNLARAIATEMGLSFDEIDSIRLAGSIHDLGKIGIPSEILSMPRGLTPEEFNLIKTHPRRGSEILEGIEFPWPLADIVIQHHERLDGSGYPQQMKGNEILLQSRIIAVADVVEAIASHRPYRPALGIESALAEIEEKRGVLYDANAVDACRRLFREKEFDL